MKMIYLDNAATTRTDSMVLESMLPYFSEYYGNPSGVYGLSAKSAAAIDEAREKAASLLGAKPSEVYFTSGGSESDNWAITSAAGSAGGHGHIITTAVEHHAVLNTCRRLEREGFKVTYLQPDACGRIDPADVEGAVRPDTVLISVMHANNEIGTIEPIKEIGGIARKYGIIFHTDAVQTFGHIPIDVKDLNIDILSASAHKMYGPKGTGLLFIRTGIALEPFMRGGAQERGLRAGTENVAGIVGFGRAAELAGDRMKDDAARERRLASYFAGRVLSEIPGTVLNGPPVERASGISADISPAGNECGADRLANNVNICFRGRMAEILLIRLDMEGICASAGAACASGSADPSHVLLAAGLSAEEALSSVRFTLGRDTTAEDLDRTVEVLKTVCRG